MCCDISNYFVKKCSILSFSERPVYFFASSILSKMLNFVIFWERKVHFFHFFNFVKNGPFCHFWNVDFKLWDNYKYTMSTVCVVIYQTILSKNAQFCHFLRGPCIFSLLQFCQKCLILSFSERGKCIFFTFSILSKMVHFVIFETWTSNYEIIISILWVQYVLWYIKLFCQKCSILSFSERPVYFFAFSILSKNHNLSFSERPVHFFQFLNFCQKWSMLSFLKRGLQIMR